MTSVFRTLGQRAHRLRIGVGNESDLIVAGSISFLPKRIECVYRLRVRAQRLPQ